VQPKAKGCLDVTVSPEQVHRAMCIMHALLKALEARGLELRVDNESGQACYVTVLNERLMFSLEEQLDRQERKLTPEEKQEVKVWGYSRDIPRHSYHPSGRLSISIDNGPLHVRHRWSDSGRQKLERLLNAFIRGLVRNAERLKLDRLEEARRRREREEAEKRWREEEERRQQEEERRREEEARFQKLEQMVANWQRSQAIEAFLVAVEEAARDRCREIHPESELGLWLSWARARGLALDPIHGAFREPERGEDDVSS
jgi:hypothetical protein